MSKRTGESEDPISCMGRERMALRTRKTTLVLLTFFSFTCLGSSLASFAGFLPYAPLPATVMLLTAVGGLMAAAFYSRHT